MISVPTVKFYIGNDSFKEIREENRYYVDKTFFIEDFLTSSFPKITLITRPRRFGKTLTITMLREFFDINAENKNLFEGLYIRKNEELCRKWQNQFPVVYLTLKQWESENMEGVLKKAAFSMKRLFIQIRDNLNKRKLSKEIKESFQQVIGLNADQATLENSLLILSDILKTYYKKKVILLIDEYDVPINNAYREGFHQELIKFMRNFLGAALKGNENLEFAVLTGCLRIAKESIFTGLNNFACFGISDTMFSNAIGFTSNEVDTILKDAGLENTKPLFKEWYDGYTFGKNSEMYCPWDVSNYVFELQNDPDLKPKLYWNNTSENAIIKDFLLRRDFYIKEKFEILLNGGCVKIPLSDQLTFDLLHSSENNFWNILYLTGYLTKANEEQIKKYGNESEDGSVLLSIPNQEVRQIYDSSIKEWFSEAIIVPNKEKIVTAFWENDAGKVSTLISDILVAGISCRDYSEAFYHGILFGIFVNSGCTALSNRESGLGYYDLLFLQPGNDSCALIEIKRANSYEQLGKEAKNALDQIENKKYDASLTGNKKVVYWGIAFFQKWCMAVVRKG